MRGDEREALFLRWFRDHLGILLKVVRTYAESPHDQDDLLQDVLVNLWALLPNFQGNAKETTWIYRVALNTALVWQRGERRRQRHHASFLQCAALSRAQANPLEAHLDNETISRLYEAIRQLDKVDASLALLYLDGLSYQEMSEVLGISENYVGVKLTRIRKQLAELLGGIGDEHG